MLQGEDAKFSLFKYDVLGRHEAVCGVQACLPSDNSVEISVASFEIRMELSTGKAVVFIKLLGISILW